MERVRFHIAQMSLFLKHFFSHLVDPSEQFGAHEKLSWGEGVGVEVEGGGVLQGRLN